MPEYLLLFLQFFSFAYQLLALFFLYLGYLLQNFDFFPQLLFLLVMAPYELIHSLFYNPLTLILYFFTLLFVFY